jgi:hypothetical protein
MQSFPSYDSVRSVPFTDDTNGHFSRAAPSIVQTGAGNLCSEAHNQVAEARIRTKWIKLRSELYKESKGDSLV